MLTIEFEQEVTEHMFEVCNAAVDGENSASDDDDDERPTGEKRTFREQLAIEVAESGKFPRMFASTEY